MYRVFLRKIKYLAKLLIGGSKSISSRVFVSATIADPVNVSLIQQCKMLESIIGVSLVNQCLHSPDDALHLISTSKADLLRQDECNLMLKGNTDNHPATWLLRLLILSPGVNSGIQRSIMALEAQNNYKELYFT